MQFDDEKDYIMRMIKEVVRILISILLGKHYVQVELPEENKFDVAGKPLDEYKAMVDRGEINEAENILLDTIDYTDRQETAAAVLFYEYISKKSEDFLIQNNYSRQEVLEGLNMLAEKSGWKEFLS